MDIAARVIAGVTAVSFAEAVSAIVPFIVDAAWLGAFSLSRLRPAHSTVYRLILRDLSPAGTGVAYARHYLPHVCLVCTLVHLSIASVAVDLWIVDTAGIARVIHAVTGPGKLVVNDLMGSENRSML